MMYRNSSRYCVFFPDRVHGGWLHKVYFPSGGRQFCLRQDAVPTWLSVRPWIRGPLFPPNGYISRVIPHYFVANQTRRACAFRSWFQKKVNTLLKISTASYLYSGWNFMLLLEWILSRKQKRLSIQWSKYETGNERKFLGNLWKTIWLVDPSAIWGTPDSFWPWETDAQMSDRVSEVICLRLCWNLRLFTQQGMCKKYGFFHCLNLAGWQTTIIYFFPLTKCHWSFMGYIKGKHPQNTAVFHRI